MKYYEDAKTGSEEYTVKDVYYRSENNHLQGLYYDKDSHSFYESSGLYGQSHVQKLVATSIEPVNLVPSKVHTLEASDFANGLSPRSATEFVLLTWRERKIFTLDRTSLDLVDEFALPGMIREGWGVTADESQANANGYYQLYISDGTSYIYLVDGETLTLQRTIRVRDGQSYVENISELEFADGHIYANVGDRDEIVKINPADG